MCQAILAPTATAEEAVRVAHALYVRLEELLATKGTMIRVGRDCAAAAVQRIPRIAVRARRRMIIVPGWAITNPPAAIW
jgi:hypothetical protein